MIFDFFSVWLGTRQTICALNVACRGPSDAIGIYFIIFANFIDMILLNGAAYVFISKINERYGDSYKKAKWTVGGYLLVFSASFFVRGTTDVLN